MSNTILFPPIVDTYQEAFVFKTEKDEGDKEITKGSATLKFTNPNNDGGLTLEISVTDRNNRSVLNSSPVGKNENGNTTCEITNGNVNFTPGNWYKVQGRYKKGPDTSEWSTVSLIKAINQPILNLTSPSESVTSSSVNVSGTISIEKDVDSIKSYQITLQDEKDTIVEKTGTLYPLYKNQIGPHQLKHTLLDGETYNITVEYETNGFYKGIKTIKMKCNLEQKTLRGLFQVNPINEKGYVEIQLGLANEDVETNKVYNIQRSSYKDNHSKRETLFTVNLGKFDETGVDYPNALNDLACEYSQVFADTAAEPGIIYRYYLTDGEGNEYKAWTHGNLFQPYSPLSAGGVKGVKNNNTYTFPFAENSSHKNVTISLTMDNLFYTISIQGKTQDKEGYAGNMLLYKMADKQSCIGKTYTLFSTLDLIDFIYFRSNGSESAQAAAPFQAYKDNQNTYYSVFTVPTDATGLNYCGLWLYGTSYGKGYIKEGTYDLKAVLLEGDRSQEDLSDIFTFSTFRETMLDTEHIHLTDKNSSFVLNLNPSITNYKYVVQESITNTLGSAFPFVRRSGNTKYRQFNVGGTICGYGDQDGMLLTSNSVYSLLGQSFFDQYKLANRIMPWNDYIFEKQYRDKAIEFLMDGKPKIFKSFTEGNMIVALTAVSFTPNKQLANNIYDFTATVTEIAEFTIENCQKYNCYENKAEKLWSPAEYYLIANEIDGNTAGVPGSTIEGQYLTVYEISNALRPYAVIDELAEILANDSVKRG